MKALSPLVQWPLVVVGRGLAVEMLSHTRGALAGWPAVRECVCIVCLSSCSQSPSTI